MRASGKSERRLLREPFDAGAARRQAVRLVTGGADFWPMLRVPAMMANEFGAKAMLDQP